MSFQGSQQEVSLRSLEMYQMYKFSLITEVLKTLLCFRSPNCCLICVGRTYCRPRASHRAYHSWYQAKEEGKEERKTTVFGELSVSACGARSLGTREKLRLSDASAAELRKLSIYSSGGWLQVLACPYLRKAILQITILNHSPPSCLLVT